MLSGKTLKHIIVVTDGLTNQGGCPVHAARKAGSRGITIRAVGILDTGRLGCEGRREVQRIAEAGGGTLFPQGKTMRPGGYRLMNCGNLAPGGHRMGFFKIGQVVTGRWERNRYTIVRLLGQGGTGRVYQVRDSIGRLLAMKVSGDLFAITHEHRVLVYLNNCSGGRKPDVVPRVFELDDFQVGSEVYHYLITEYCPGKNLGSRLGRLKPGEIAAVGKRVAEFLHWLHRHGFVFGDLKPGNVLYNPESGAVYIIDYGSVCLKGHGLKQYTPGYDRASWQAGTRVADEHYDMFALGMLMASLALGKVRGKDGGKLSSLYSRVLQGIRHPLLRATIVKTLKQETRDCSEIAAELSAIPRESEDQGYGQETAAFVNIVGAASVLAFIVGIVYYYQ